MKIASMMLLVLAMLTAGCSSGLKKKVEAVDWNSRIGSYTYAEAVAELGKPTALTESNAGRTAEWVLKQSPRMSFGVGLGSGTYGRRSGVGVGAGTSVSPRPRGEYLQLQFDPEGTLQGWSKVTY